MDPFTVKKNNGNRFLQAISISMIVFGAYGLNLIIKSESELSGTTTKSENAVSILQLFNSDPKELHQEKVEDQVPYKEASSESIASDRKTAADKENHIIDGSNVLKKSQDREKPEVLPLNDLNPLDVKKYDFDESVSAYFLNYQQSQIETLRYWIDSIPSSSKINCSSADKLGFTCESLSGNLGLLQKINLPAILEIKSSSGVISFVSLRRLNKNTLTLSRDGLEKEFDAELILKFWTGKATVIWRPTRKELELLAVLQSETKTYAPTDLSLANDGGSSLDSSVITREMSSIRKSTNEQKSILDLLTLSSELEDISIPKLTDEKNKDSEACEKVPR